MSQALKGVDVMRQDVVVEIMPDGRAALRLVILPPEPPKPRTESDEERGYVEIPLHSPEEEESNVIVWKM